MDLILKEDIGKTRANRSTGDHRSLDSREKSAFSTTDSAGTHLK